MVAEGCARLHVVAQCRWGKQFQIVRCVFYHTNDVAERKTEREMRCDNRNPCGRIGKWSKSGGFNMRVIDLNQKATENRVQSAIQK